MMVFTLLFVYCPLLGIVAYSVWMTRREEVPVGRIWGLAWMLSVYLGCLGATKELLGDFLTYSQYFREVPRHSLVSYLLFFGKEPLYYGFSWVSYYLLMGNWKLFVIVLTTLNYLLLSYAVIRIGVHLRTSAGNVVATLFFMAFFFQEFAAIGNMLRQGLAQSITLVFLVRWQVEGKRSWWIALCALGVHTSCLPVLGVGLLPMLRHRLSWGTFLRLALSLAVLALVFFRLGDYLAHLPFIGYIFERATASEQLLAADAWQTEVGLQPSMIALLVLLGAMVVALYRRAEEEGTGLFVFVNLNLMLLLLLVVCNALGMYYLLMRYFFYLYAFQNVLFLLYLHGSPLWQGRVPRWLMMGTLTVYFFYELSHGTFSYLPVVEALVNPLPMYIL